MITEQQIIEMVQKVGLATEDVLAEVKKIASQENRQVSDVLIERNVVKPDQLGQLIATLYKVKFVDLRKESVPSEILHIIPEIVAAKKLAIAFKRDAEGLQVALADPEDYEFVKMLEKKTGDRIRVYYSPEFLIRSALGQYRVDIKSHFEDVIKINVLKAKGARAEDVSIIKIVDTLIEYAFHNRASDIHIEPHKEDVQVRFRIDGILHDVLTLPLSILELIVTRIKILSKLRTDEHRSAQDGKMTMEIEKQELDIRVSILPITQGEKVVMRLLTPDSRLNSLEELGLSSHDLQIVKNAVAKPHGMILSTGPTGSGKTTTLYSLLRLVSSREVNISTIEDPVEYYLEGMNQIQVNPKTNLTFASGLRSLLRQDPDIIMVGEIRDEETASIAINSAMTGHLVLSTLHTNDAATALPRLYDMHVEPFLVASTIDIIIGQRLVRRICTKCITSYSISEDELRTLFGAEVDVSKYVYQGQARVYKGKGDNSCQHTGYQGRVGIFEVLEMNDEIRQLVINKADSDRIRGSARKHGMITMIEDGLEKVFTGKTTVEEIVRVVKG
ncbi:MAG: type II/IV secretion system protein [Candidatus Komeilibacteria bacterium]|nr:type II/IV secretion system protein [Candidatus Komeilibacteria bacterium]